MIAPAPLSWTFQKNVSRFKNHKISEALFLWLFQEAALSFEDVVFFALIFLLRISIPTY